ncbi:hypothetical protein PLUA15_230182 [Pseudomonas lundensis]|uniref:Uncharacterized protein n=1 Tax=Pseudomonas lundensis TaxID=86185 RepID=A0AAX2H6Q4_9PSED|nr:hypothetical protein PLUA15_230182 [Pseudomonas lundensis]
MTDDGLVNRLAAKDQEHRILISIDMHLSAITIEQSQLAFACHLLAIQLHGALEHHQCGVVAFAQIKRSRLAPLQPDIPHLDVSKGVRRATETVEFTGNQAQPSGVVLEGYIRDIPIQNALITRCGHFVFGGQVDPQLNHLQGAATAGECLGMEFFMQDPGRRRHPLHITGADHPTVTGGIAVFDFALVNDGDGFKPAMRVLPYAATLGGRREFGGSCVIQQQEWADVFTHLVVRKHRAYRETITDPVATRRCVNAKNVFHRVPPVIHGNSLDSMRFVD